MQPFILNINHAAKNSTFNQNWYALYTRPYHEKRIYEQLKLNKIEAYLPLQTTIRKWSDRNKKVTRPLFSCYLFVFISLKDYYKVLNIPGVVRYISFEGKAAIIPEKQIQMIKDLLTQDIEVTEPLENLPVRTTVEIKVGPLKGFIGELVEFAGRKRVLISLEEICKSVLINVPLNYLAFAG